MFGKKIEIFYKMVKELQEKNSELHTEQKEMKQRIYLLESEVKRLTAILEFLTYKKKIEDMPSALTETSHSHGINDILIPDGCVQKIDKLSNIEFATKEDLNRIDARFLEILNTISGLFKAFGNSNGNNNKSDEDTIL